MPSPRGVTLPESSSPQHYKSFEKSCILLCPNNYIQTEKPDGNLTCEPCSKENDCRRECNGGVVNNIASAQQLKYCTHILQSLEIKIIGAINIVKELEENLAMIQEINGYLKIVRSYPLVSLNFLKSLKKIRGSSLDNGRYSLVVMDNANLQDLWDWKKHGPIEIGNGSLSFHFNPKLCKDKIDELRNMSKTPLEIDQNSNGDRVPCNVKRLNVTIAAISQKAVLIKWEPFPYPDQRVLLGYVVSRMKARYRNVTVYDGRDACGGDGWIVEDVANQPQASEFLHIFTHLESYTQYAFYVKTYTIASAVEGGQSPVLYFTTLPDQPSPPQKMTVHSNSSSEIVVKWEPPITPNGNVTHYIIDVKYQPDVNDRNYCKDAIKVADIKPIVKEEIFPASSDNTCNCSSNEIENKPKIIGQAEADNSISFEDQLQNQVYIKYEKPNPDRYKRMILDSDVQLAKERYSEESQRNYMIESNATSSANPNTSIHPQIKTNGTSFVIKNLKHYALYSISLRACRERVAADKDNKLCSESKMRNERTLKLEGSDDITVFRAQVISTNQSLGEVVASWEEPKEPNGLIYMYQIEYNRVDLIDAKPVPICVTQQDFIDRNRMYAIKNLTPGNYSIRVMAVSKAGNGKYSEMKYFLIMEPSTGLTSGEIVGYTFLALLLSFILSILAYFVHRKYFSPPSIKLITSVNPEYVSMQYQPDEWEVPREKIKLIRELGQGSFGMVYEGIACDLVQGNSEIKCAIKTVNEHATDRERIEFLNEASVMKAFDTAHVVRLLGVVSRGQPTLVVMELMANGDLKSYLRSHRPDSDVYDPEICVQPPTLKRILQMAIEIADGMAYLSAKKFVHRDLAARNCMVSENLTVKIGDFGMTRDIYETDYYRKGTKGLLPVRWMAPESLKDGVFTSSSDVWSYGVVLWEMATLASQPYQGLSNDQVLRYVIDGGVMERPENCPDQLYELMRLTWQHKPSARPSFFELETLLHADANPEFKKISFYHSPQGQEALINMQNTILVNDDPSTPLHHTEDDEFQSEFDVKKTGQQMPKPDLMERLLSRHEMDTTFSLDQKVGSYQDSMSYIGSTPGTSYGHRDREFSEDAGSLFGSRSPAFYSITNKSNAVSPERRRKDSEEEETQFSTTAPMLLSNANGYIMGAITSKNGTANIKTADR
ncbi:insulin-like receptor [Ctenocephalides felis]|uniref:insulin-like receptor n=1 Tax=Ctenocephalides felis TaxID=7515 RepID=UPI000E6E196B|nr:insulin-like receptor [Ctenocephalides felis]